jgi:hypothetical protein
MRLRSRGTTIALLIGIGIGIGALPAIARDRVELVSEWHLTPEATRAHPKKLQIAIVVTEASEIVACELWESRERNWLSESEPPTLTGGGKVIATLKIVKEASTLKIGKQAKAMEVHDFDPWGGLAPLGWTDPSAFVCEGCPSNLSYKRTGKLPAQVEPGDVIIWALKLKGMAPLQVEPTVQPPYSDEIRFFAKCRSCGSVGHPCPDPW